MFQIIRKEIPLLSLRVERVKNTEFGMKIQPGQKYLKNKVYNTCYIDRIGIVLCELQANSKNNFLVEHSR